MQKRNVMQRRSMGASGASFLPLNIPGLEGWYDFADVSTLFQDTARTSPITADGQVIKGVKDKSPSARHLAAATDGPAYKVGILGGRSIARFSAARTDSLDMAASPNLSQPNTLFLVAKTPATVAQNNIVCTSTIGGENTFYINPTDSFAGYYAGTTVVSNVVVDDDQADAWCGVFNGASSKLYIGGGAAVATGNPGTQNILQPFRIGGAAGTSFKYTGDIAEVILYNRLLSLGEINNVGAYLMRWSISWAVAI